MKNGIKFMAIVFILLADVAFAAEGGGKGGLLSPKPGLLVWTTITFFTVMFVLKKLAWKPLLSMLDEREKSIRDAIESSQKAQEDSKKVLDDARQKLKEATDEAKQILEEARKKSSQIQEEAREKTEKDCMRLRRQVENQIERAKERALEEVWKTVGDVSTSIAERLIDKSLKGKDHNQLIDKSIKEIRERMEAS